MGRLKIGEPDSLSHLPAEVRQSVIRNAREILGENARPSWAMICAGCGFDEATDPSRQVYVCDGCRKPVCSECSVDGRENAVLCFDCNATTQRAEDIQHNVALTTSSPRVARFRLVGRIDGVEGCTVSISRGAQTFSVRPLRRKRAYTLPLMALAEYTLHTVAKGERLKAQAEKRRKRRGRR